jgi:hypothetical protein
LVTRFIFLSHQSANGAAALRLARDLEGRFERNGTIDVRVFVTADPAYRFRDLLEVLEEGDDWKLQLRAWANQLREYLTEHLEGAVAYLLLLTDHSMRRDSAWVRWEIQEATKIARERHIPFIPCLLGVGFEALRERPMSRLSLWQLAEVGDLETGNPEIEFQGIRIDDEAAIGRLADSLFKG